MELWECEGLPSFNSNNATFRLVKYAPCRTFVITGGPHRVKTPLKPAKKTPQ